MWARAQIVALRKAGHVPSKIVTIVKKPNSRPVTSRAVRKTWEKSKANPHWRGEQGVFGGRGLWHGAPRFGLARHGSSRFGLGHRMAWLAPPGLGSAGPGLARCVPGRLRPAPVQMGGDRLGLVLLDFAWLGSTCAEEFGSPYGIRRALHAISLMPVELLEKACVFLIDVDRRAAECYVFLIDVSIDVPKTLLFPDRRCNY